MNYICKHIIIFEFVNNVNRFRHVHIFHPCILYSSPMHSSFFFVYKRIHFVNMVLFCFLWLPHRRTLKGILWIRWQKMTLTDVHLWKRYAENHFIFSCSKPGVMIKDTLHNIFLQYWSRKTCRIRNSWLLKIYVYFHVKKKNSPSVECVLFFMSFFHFHFYPLVM